MESLNLNSQERELHQLQQMQDNAKESCMTSFRLLHSFLQINYKISLTKMNSKKIKSMATFWVLNNQFQKFIDWQYFLDYDSEMTEKPFAKYIGIKYDRRMNERQMQSKESKVVSSKALDASLVVTECSGTKSDEHITSSSSGTYITYVVDADIKPVNNQVPFAKVHLTAQHNVLANEQQHIDQFELSYDTYLLEKVDSNTTLDSTNMSHRGGEIDQDAEQDQVKSPLLNAEFFNTKDMVEKEIYNELSNRFLQLEKHCISLEISIQQKEESFQSNKPFTLYYFPKVREYVRAKSHHVIAPRSSRNSQEESYGSNDMAHNHYLEEARKKTQERNRNSKSSVMHTTCLQITTNSCKQKPGSNNQTSRSFPVSKSSGVTSNSVPLIPTGKMFIDSTTKVDSEPPNGSHEDITNLYECDQTLNVSACTLNLSVVAAQEPVASTGTPSSTTIDQDAPSTIAHMEYDLYFGLLIPEPSSIESSSRIVIPTNLADIFTNPLGRERLEFLMNKLGMQSMSPETLKRMADETEEYSWLTISSNVEVSFFKLLCTTDDIEDMTFDVYALPCYGLVLFVMALFIHAL
ncbi:hypothetical protein Tco_0712734 [Tanacetum coccineum]